MDLSQKRLISIISIVILVSAAIGPHFLNTLLALVPLVVIIEK